MLSPNVFEILERTEPGKGGEIQLTDALQELAQQPGEPGGGVYGVVFRGRRYDTGDRLDYLKAVVQIAVDRPDLGPDFRTWLGEFSQTLSTQRPGLAGADVVCHGQGLRARVPGAGGLVRGHGVAVPRRDGPRRQVVRRGDVGGEDAAHGVAQHDVEGCDRSDCGEHGR